MPTGTDWRTRRDGDKARRYLNLCGAWRLWQAEAGRGGAIQSFRRHALERGGLPDYEPSGGRASFPDSRARRENDRSETGVTGYG